MAFVTDITVVGLINFDFSLGAKIFLLHYDGEVHTCIAQEGQRGASIRKSERETGERNVSFPGGFRRGLLG